ncbi:hypothetical protein M405DRAFT_883651 [Rhizopogon salebrosus TDB-379]|nr:hypothetical protein M405DRAFT_883651 [Rhizopogon salebrosus TDB-379]
MNTRSPRYRILTMGPIQTASLLVWVLQVLVVWCQLLVLPLAPPALPAHRHRHVLIYYQQLVFSRRLPPPFMRFSAGEGQR